MHIGSTVCSVFFSLRSFREVSFKPTFAGTTGILVLFIHMYVLFWLVESGLSCKLQGTIHHYELKSQGHGTFEVSDLSGFHSQTVIHGWRLNESLRLFLLTSDGFSAACSPTKDKCAVEWGAWVEEGWVPLPVPVWIHGWQPSRTVQKNICSCSTRLTVWSSCADATAGCRSRHVLTRCHFIWEGAYVFSRWQGQYRTVNQSSKPSIFALF